MKQKKFPIPENILELLFGAGASVVIIGALLKITHNDFIFSGNTWLTGGLVTEAVIFLIAGIRGYYMATESSAATSTDAADLSGISKEAEALKAAYQNATAQLETLGTNLSDAVSATANIDVPTDFQSNMSSLNNNVSETSAALEQLAKAYTATQSAVATEPAAHTKMVADMDGLHAELSTLKQTVANLNAKYADILGAMKN
jgi:gliding motility-associated protein GldL